MSLMMAAVQKAGKHDLAKIVLQEALFQMYELPKRDAAFRKRWSWQAKAE